MNADQICVHPRFKIVLTQPVLAVARVIDTTIDQRVGFRFEHVMPARDFNPLFVVLARRLEIVKLAINPPDAMRNIVSTRSFSLPLVRRLQALRLHARLSRQVDVRRRATS